MRQSFPQERGLHIARQTGSGGEDDCEHRDCRLDVFHGFEPSGTSYLKLLT
jgi:hypothetical protein